MNFYGKPNQYAPESEAAQYFQRMLSARPQRGPMVLVAREPGRMGATHFVSRSHVKYWRKAYFIAFKTHVDLRLGINAKTNNWSTPYRMRYLAGRDYDITLPKEHLRAELRTMRGIRLVHGVERWPMLPAPYVAPLSEYLGPLWQESAHRQHRAIEAAAAVGRRKLLFRYRLATTTDAINTFLLGNRSTEYISNSTTLYELMRLCERQSIDSGGLFDYRG